MAIDFKKVEDQLRVRYGSFSIDMAKVKKLYDKLKETVTDTYYVRSQYGENNFYKERGEDVRNYIFPISIFGSEDGKEKTLSGSYYIDACTMSALGYMSEQENWSIKSGSSGRGENDPNVEYITIVIGKEVLDKFVEEKLEQQHKENTIIKGLSDIGVDITKLSREQLENMKKIFVDQTGKKTDSDTPQVL